MVEFELVVEENLKYFRLKFNGHNIGMISTEGVLFWADVARVGYIGLEDWKLIGLKIEEVKKFGVVTCKRCGGSPMSPQKIGSEGIGYTCRESIHPKL